MLDKLVGLIAPHSCLVCGCEGGLLCEWCGDEALIPVPSRCYRCQASTEDFAVCASCRTRTRLRHVWVRGGYDDLPKQLVYKLKFGRAGAAAVLIARMIGESLPYLPESTVVCHVPTATTRRRQRGYDQAELIARSLARAKGLPHRVWLRRQGQSRQVGASRPERQKQLESAFRAVRSSEIKGSTILLVDDIVTTGATLEAAAAALRNAGAGKIYAAVFAQKM